MNQNVYSIAIGYGAGQNNQGFNSVALGYQAGQTNQSTNCFAIGYQAGQISQNAYSVGIGYWSGQNSQGFESVAVGAFTGYLNPQSSSVAIGYSAGSLSQQYQAVSIGNNAGSNSQGTNSVAIGAFAGRTNQSASSIILNATGNTLNTGTTGMFVGPIRGLTGTSTLNYNTSTSEITYITRSYIKLTQLFDNAGCNTTGNGPLVCWTASYTSIGGMLLFLGSFSCLASSGGFYTFNLQIDGTTVDTVFFCINLASDHWTIPSTFHVNTPLSVGSHTISLQIPSGTYTDSNDRMNMTIQEFVGLS
jgi:hypothetical protein